MVESERGVIPYLISSWTKVPLNTNLVSFVV